MANATRVAHLTRARALLAVPLSPLIAVPERTQANPDQPVRPTAKARPCPCCGAPLVIIETFRRGHAPRAPPAAISEAA